MTQWGVHIYNYEGDMGTLKRYQVRKNTVRIERLERSHIMFSYMSPKKERMKM